MLYVWVCVQACVKSNSLIPLMLPFGKSIPPKQQGLLCIAQSMTPGWRVLRSTLKPCVGEDRRIRLQVINILLVFTIFNIKSWNWCLKEYSIKITHQATTAASLTARAWLYLWIVRTTGLSYDDQARSAGIIQGDALQSVHQAIRTWCHYWFRPLAVTIHEEIKLKNKKKTKRDITNKIKNSPRANM